METYKQHPVAVLGAGPVGLAAAAHLLERGFAPVVFEASSSVAASFRDFGHVRLFSPWRYNVDGASKRLLEKTEWVMPDEEALPTAGEVVDHYLVPLSKALPDVRSNARVVAVARSGYDKVKTEGREKAPFVVRVETGNEIHEELVSAVIDATGTWNQPNPLGANGLPAVGEERYQQRIAYGMPDVLNHQRPRYAGKTVLVVGAGHSAVGSLVALAELAEGDTNTHVHWALRSGNPSRAFGGGEADQLPARGALGLRLKKLIDAGRLTVHTNFRIRELRESEGALTVIPENTAEARGLLHGIDEIICATGSRPDLEMVRELRVRTDVLLESSEALAPLIDPNLHSCGTVRPHGYRELSHPEPDFFIVGAKSYGRAPTFLMATGYEQVRSIAAALAGDLAAANDVQLDLPETGVCITDNTPEGAAGTCCAPPEKSPAVSEDAGCGCGGPEPAKSPTCCG